MDMEAISNFFRDSYKTVEFNSRHLLSSSRKIIVSSNEIKGLEHGFHLEQSKIKLHAAESSHSFTEEELEALRWAKHELEHLDLPIKSDVLAFRNKIEKVDRELDSYHKHLLAAYMELVQVKNEMDVLSERKEMYNSNLKDMQVRYSKKRRGKFMNLLAAMKFRRDRSKS
jgi:predicted  nucleic acid-binding Zn-ribbon protein